MRSKIIKWTVILGLIAAVGWHFWSSRAVTLPPGVMAPNDPVQIKLKDPAMIPMGEFSIMPLAEFQIQAKVLGTQRYRWGKESKLSPVDLALGWGRMSDQRVADAIKIHQSRRWYQWSAKSLPISMAEIKTHSANMHIIPANDEVEKTLKSLRRGQIITIDGYLVRAIGDNGWEWNSSLSREDIGSGACEVVYAKELSISAPSLD